MHSQLSYVLLFSFCYGLNVCVSLRFLTEKEMARVNIDILGVSKLKWTGMGEFNSDDHYIYYCRQESLRRNGLVLIREGNGTPLQYSCLENSMDGRAW